MTGQTQYERGRRIEQKIVDFLKQDGCVAYRSAGSKGAFDIIAYNGEHIRLIQSKLTASEKTRFTKEIGKINAEVVPPCASKELWIYVTNMGFTTIMTTDRKLRYPLGARIDLFKT